MDTSIGYAKSQYNGNMAANTAMPVMPTVASALGRIDHLNERLSQVAGRLSSIAVAVGGPYPTGAAAGEKMQPDGMVMRLNESADNAHRQLGDIEELVASIGRALG